MLYCNAHITCLLLFCNNLLIKFAAWAPAVPVWVLGPELTSAASGTGSGPWDSQVPAASLVLPPWEVPILSPGRCCHNRHHLTGSKSQHACPTESHGAPSVPSCAVHSWPNPAAWMLPSVPEPVCMQTAAGPQPRVQGCSRDLLSFVPLNFSWET